MTAATLPSRTFLVAGVRRPLHKNWFIPLGFSCNSPCRHMEFSHRRAASWSRPRSAYESMSAVTRTEE